MISISLWFSAPPSVTRVTAVLAHSSGELLLLGTEGGHVFIVEVPGFRELEERNISLDQVASRSASYDTRHHLWPIVEYRFVKPEIMISWWKKLYNCCNFCSGIIINAIREHYLLILSSSVPDDYIGRRNLEHVEALQENPVDPNQVVIGYGRGLMVIWDLVKECAIQHIPATQVIVLKLIYVASTSSFYCVLNILCFVTTATRKCMVDRGWTTYPEFT